jgi:hypothetical protein
MTLDPLNHFLSPKVSIRSYEDNTCQESGKDHTSVVQDFK